MRSLRNSFFERREVICISVTRQLPGQVTELCRPRFSDFPKLSVTALFCGPEVEDHWGHPTLSPLFKGRVHVDFGGRAGIWVFGLLEFLHLGMALATLHPARVVARGASDCRRCPGSETWGTRKVMAHHRISEAP